MTTELNKLRAETNAHEHSAILEAIRDMKEAMVMKAEFKPVRNVVYGMVGICMVFVLQQLLTSVVAASGHWGEILAYVQNVI